MMNDSISDERSLKMARLSDPLMIPMVDAQGKLIGGETNGDRYEIYGPTHAAGFLAVDRVRYGTKTKKVETRPDCLILEYLDDFGKTRSKYVVLRRAADCFTVYLAWLR
jgi:hypothetical protein